MELDQDDRDYENDTNVTARRTNVEMSEEGHYESLDLHKIGDAVYGDLRTKKKLSGRRPFRVVVGVAVCLCLIMAGVTIAQAVHVNYGSASNRLKSNDTQTLENNLNQEKDLLQSEVNQLKTQIADRPCPCGWKKFGESCYYITTGWKTWQEGRDECQSQGADLVVINSREEQVFIRGLRTTWGYYGSWIGLTRTQGSWTWVDGTPLTTEYWASGYPHNDGDRCAAYDHWTNPGTWFNVGCSATTASICETK